MAEGVQWMRSDTLFYVPTPSSLQVLGRHRRLPWLTHADGREMASAVSTRAVVSHEISEEPQPLDGSYFSSPSSHELFLTLLGSQRIVTMSIWLSHAPSV
jgi:hypothetical protein